MPLSSACLAPRLLRTCLLVSLLLGQQLVWSQPRSIQPGLWENKMTNPEMVAARASMEAELAKMPAAQRQQMEKMMASQGAGMSKDGATRVCLSAAMISKDPAGAPAREGCTHTMSWSGNVAKMEMSCKSGEKGKGEFTYASDKAYQGWMEMQGKKGRTQRMTFEAKWLAADCGAIKPLK